MKTIAIIGDVDKRILVYPLIRALSIENSIMIATDDGAYRRLYQDSSDIGTIGKVDIVVGSKFEEDMLKLTDKTGIAYDICLAVLNDNISIPCDFAVYCKGVNNSFSDAKYIHKISNVKSKEAVISCSIPRDKNVDYIMVDENIVRYLFYVEEYKQLKILSNKKVNKTIAKLFNEPLGKTEQQLYKLLVSKNAWDSKKK